MEARRKREFGDFQTPRELALLCCQRLAKFGLKPGSVFEPTCGLGNLLIASLDHFPSVSHALGIDINQAHLAVASRRLANRDIECDVELRHDDVFKCGWQSWVVRADEPLLVLGNPPWVTNAELGAMESKNLPGKTNRAGLAGIQAVTGRSNFDISQWLISKICSELNGRHATLAVLCKTSVARKVLADAWNAGTQFSSASLFRINAGRWFSANVDACFLVCEFVPGAGTTAANVYEDLEATRPDSRLGWCDSELVADVDAFERSRWLRRERQDRREMQCADDFVWRSGVKHDCAAVMELCRSDDGWRNGLGELVDIEPNQCYPLLKGSDVARGRLAPLHRRLVLTQKSLNSDTEILQTIAPRTWAYLTSHASRLDSRKSSIYRGRSRFAIFGIGPYTFSPFKVAVCGLYKSAQFQVIEPDAGRPVVFDDTIYFLPCTTIDQCRKITDLLQSEPAREYFSARVFRDAKRPITAVLLQQLDLRKLARHQGKTV